MYRRIVEPMTEREIRASFVNVSKGEASRINLPRNLSELPWADLDYAGWRDPQSPTKGYLVTRIDGQPQGIALRAPSTGTGNRRSMCSLCMTVHSGGVALMVAPRSGKAGQQGNSVGTYICADLCCPLYIRGKLPVEIPTVRETITTEERIERLARNLAAFLGRVTAS